MDPVAEEDCVSLEIWMYAVMRKRKHWIRVIDRVITQQEARK
jgi:hypothetical protein